MIIKQKRRGFTLLEVLIAVAVFFVVGAAVVSLSNTLVRGTIDTADEAIANRWASEGLEFVTKLRDDNWIKSTPYWLEQARESGLYGWHTLSVSGGIVTLRPLTGIENRVTQEDLYNQVDAEELKSDTLTAKRFICIESFGAVSAESNLYSYCNSRDLVSSTPALDGSRNSTQFCTTNDTYCEMSRDSINRNSLNTTPVVIPAGNIVKVRSFVIWPNGSGYETSEMGTILTNWKGLDR